MTNTFYKSPYETLDYTVEWVHVLGSATISSVTWTVPAGLVQGASSISGTTTTVFIGGGVAGTFYDIEAEIVTSAADTFTQGFVILCKPDQPTSGVSIFNVTRNDIIMMALEDIRVYAPDFESLNPAAVTRASTRLNMMIRGWQAAGVGLWLNQLVTMPVVVGQTSYLMGPDGNPAIPRPMAIVECRRVDSSGDETTMIAMSRDEYMNLPLKTTQGIPTQYYYDPQTQNGVFYSWPTASTATDTFVMTVKTPIQDFQGSTDYPDFPVEWADALHFNLALRLVPAYNVPQDVAAFVAQMATLTLDNADGFDREQNVAAQFVPDGDWG